MAAKTSSIPVQTAMQDLEVIAECKPTALIKTYVWHKIASFFGRDIFFLILSMRHRQE